MVRLIVVLFKVIFKSTYTIVVIDVREEGSVRTLILFPERADYAIDSLES